MSCERQADVEADGNFHRVKIKCILEALLFSTSQPLSFQKIREVIDTAYAVKPPFLRELVLELQEDYISQGRAFRLEEIGEGFLLRTYEEYSPYIDLLQKNKRSEKLSQAGAEVLAIIAYRQPITRPQIDAIRGVDSSGAFHSLLERNLIETQGKLEVAGRPSLYVTTKDFLKTFGLKDIKELPELSTLGAMQEA